MGKRKYYTHRFVMEHRRVRGRRRRTVLNLGVHFSVPKRQWNLLCFMVECRLRPAGLLDLDSPELVPVAEDITRRVRAKWESSEAGKDDDLPSAMDADA
ncbi:MAG: hypothetical protein OXP36_07810 [Gammaproteobacteria bacterium]|nr:hypothetical protein [Gammaproteobacteria bacterium]